MEWKRIQIFIKVAQHKSFTEASTVLKKSQSTLSRNIIKLEKKAGYNVFLRNIKGIKLTEKGKKLLIIANEFNSKLKYLT